MENDEAWTALAEIDFNARLRNAIELLMLKSDRGRSNQKGEAEAQPTESDASASRPDQ
jgi:hypothetical protein